jgi:uncharacterized protein (DUF362 family)
MIIMEDKTKRLVSLVNTYGYDDLNEAVEQALSLILFDFKRKIRKIAIKPNLCYYWKSSTGETTDPKVVGAVADVLRMHYTPDEIYLVESDATAMQTKHAFKMLDYEKLAAEKNMKLINLCEDTLLPVNDDVTTSFPHEIKIPKILTEVDLFVSVPTLKVHGLTGITCALKNQFGCIPIRRKVIFHKNLSKVIAFINKCITPDLILVDGLISTGKTPKRLNLIMAGYDPVAVDFIAAKITGLNPKRIKHIVESKNQGVGSVDAECIGEDWLQFANKFPRKGFLNRISRKSLMQFYNLYLRIFTLEGRIFKQQSAEGGR